MSVSPIKRTPSVVPCERLGYSKPEAAAALGMSVDSFERHVQPELRVIRRGKLRIFSRRELERWLDENQQRAVEARGHEGGARLG